MNMSKKLIKNIISDPGHGGFDYRGHYTTSPKKQAKILLDGKKVMIREGILNREIAEKVDENLIEFNDKLNIVTTVKPTGEDVSLKRRCIIANRLDSDTTLFMSHHNNAYNGKASGFEIWTSVGETDSDILAKFIWDEVEPVYNGNLEVKLPMRVGESYMDPSKEKQFYVLKNTNCPAVLIEYGFFDNPKDYKFVKDNMDVIARAVAIGTIKFTLRNNKKALKSFTESVK